MENGKYCIEKNRKKRAKSQQNMAILGIKTWKMENIAENVWKVGIRTRQGFGELKNKISDHRSDHDLKLSWINQWRTYTELIFKKDSKRFWKILLVSFLLKCVKSWRSFWQRQISFFKDIHHLMQHECIVLHTTLY